jgi:hypothetical protein
MDANHLVNNYPSQSNYDRIIFLTCHPSGDAEVDYIWFIHEFRVN